MKPIFFLLLILSGPLASFAQDIITTRDGIRIQAKVIEITPADVRYKDADNTEGPTIVLERKRILKIEYPNGKETVFEDQKQAAIANPDVSYFPAETQRSQSQPVINPDEITVNMYDAGQLEAVKYYSARGVFWTTAGTTFLTAGLGGIVLGGILVAIPPSINSARISDRNLMKDPSFKAGFKKQARKKRIASITAGFSVGLVALVTIIIASAE